MTKPFSKYFLSVDGLILFFLPLVAVVISFVSKPNFFVSILLFLGLPALYISIRSPKYILKSIIFSFLAGVPLMIILEYIGGSSLSWAFSPSAFNFYLLDRVSIEVLLWSFLNIYTVIVFYEFMFDSHKKVNVWQKKMWNLIWYLIGWLVLFIILLFVTDGEISFPYFYFLFGIVIFIFPIVIAWLRYPKILPKTAYSLIYFAYLSFLYEITALSLGWWTFPGKQFIGYITVGKLTFPIEELVFWIILFAPAVISAFEYLDDDRR